MQSIKNYIFFFIGTRFKKVITNLEESLEIKTTEAQHLTELVAKMESSSSSDEMNKVQIGMKKNMTTYQKTNREHARANLDS